MTDDDPAVQAAMTILLGSGDARRLVGESLNALAEGCYDEAGELLTQAQATLKAAHAVHTDVIQTEAAVSAEQGESGVAGFPVLFSHAQDTMMTTDSEIRLVKRLLPAFRGMDERLTALEKVRVG
jgi:cellobiose PTS system EIIA component